MLRLIIDFSTALRMAMRPLEEPAPIVTFSAALRNATWLVAPPPMCACLSSERSMSTRFASSLFIPIRSAVVRGHSTTPTTHSRPCRAAAAIHARQDGAKTCNKACRCGIRHATSRFRSGRRDGTRLRSLATDSAASPLAGAACEERSCFKTFFVTVRQGR